MVNDKHIVNPFVNTSEAEKYKFILDGYLSEKYFLELVQVIALNEDGTIDVLPLVIPVSFTEDAPVDNTPIYNIPVFQLQRANSAIIMMPVVGDIGLIAVCDKDITLVKENKSSAVAQTMRMHSRMDAIYIGGVLNKTPSQFIKFEDNALTITTPSDINISATTLNIKAKTNITGDTNIDGNLTVTKNITAMNITASSNIADGQGSLGEVRMKYTGHYHYVTVDGSKIASTTPQEDI